MVIASKPQVVEFEQAPCQPDGVISREGQEESKEGTCRCSRRPDGCCVDGIGVIRPRVLKGNNVSKEVEEVK